MPTAADVFWALHSELPREGVGSDRTTRELLDLAGPLPARPRAVDVGCGPGRSGRRRGVAGLAAAGAAGYDVVATRLLPDSDWEDEYYGPLERRIDAWPDPDAETAAALAGNRAEIERRRAHPGDYGYLAVVLRRR